MGSWNTMHDAVRDHTPVPLNQRIDAAVERRVACLAALERQDITRRLQFLERAPDVGRATDFTAAVFTLFGVAMLRRDGAGLFRGKGVGWWALPILSCAALFQRALTGTAFTVPLFRRLGLRNRREIDVEKFALKALRGDFERIPHEGGPKLRANAALVAAQS